MTNSPWFVLSHQYMAFMSIFQELELLPAKDLQQNVYIKHPVSIEQYLMEGSYNKVRIIKGMGVKIFSFWNLNSVNNVWIVGVIT